MSGLSESARALLIAHHKPTPERPTDSFTSLEAAAEWKVVHAAAESRIRRMMHRGEITRTIIGRVAYYHAPLAGRK